jgi:exodeoxyribonuclease VII small subunit
MDKSSSSHPEDLTYEAALEQLDAIIASLEGGDLPLEEALARYEEGAALAALCEQKLNEAELRVRKWRPGDETGGETSDFHEWEG